MRGGLAAFFALPGAFGAQLRQLSGSQGLSYYTRENCIAKGYLPKWNESSYVPSTHFEKIFKTPLNIDLIAAAHSGNETGFEQVTADWGCGFDSCYGTGEAGECQSVGFYGPGAKDPAGGGCPRGPIKVYEDLTCAIRLGLEAVPTSFSSFCDVTSDEDMGTFECLSFFANVLTETGAFAETEERDPRPYCWDRSGTGPGFDCCPASDHQPCLPDSGEPLGDADYPTPASKWLSDSEESGKCCSYHGRGFLQVSYEPNYKALSKAMFGDETVLWHHPYKLDSDGVAGWTAALWFWFNEHPAQTGNTEGAAVVATSPRSELYKYKEGHGFPGTINVINGAECSGSMDSKKAFTRASLLFAIAHRMGAKPPTAAGENAISHYPLPGTDECESNEWCRTQFHNPQSVCPAFSSHVNCNTGVYVVNASTPMGFWRHTIKTVAVDGATPLCTSGTATQPMPAEWAAAQEALEPIAEWWKYVDVHRDNVCNYTRLYYRDPETDQWTEGRSDLCQTMCHYEFAWDLSQRETPCDEPQLPCRTIAYYLTSPTPRKNWESGDMGDYMGGAYIGRVGPGLVQAMNGYVNGEMYGLGDVTDGLCYWYGGSACHWNVGMGCYAKDNVNIHNCRVFHPDASKEEVLKTLEPPKSEEQLEPGQFPQKLNDVLKYYDFANCPTPTGKSVLEQILPRGLIDIDYLFSAHYSQSDGFSNSRYDTDDVSDNDNSITQGIKGPQYLWARMLCAYLKGVPDDPEIFQRSFGLREDVTSAANVPYPLSEDQKRFALLEFAAMASNMIKETGAFGQAEEQDPRCYCNYMGGSENPCCPNDFGNNPPCYTTTDSGSSIIPDDEMARGLTVNAQCCSYHGRGYLQTSYELNYGDLGAQMFKSSANGVTEDEGRRLLLNYPQVIDGFGVTGWTATWSFWLTPHPCAYCEGKNTTTVDWNAALESPHIAMQQYDVPGMGLGKTYTIVNGQECEAFMSKESDIAMWGASERLSFFYNLAYRLRLKAPGEDTILPLPGTKECDSSAFCRGTFLETPEPVASYRIHGGGCWALTPQPVDDGASELWTYCKPQKPLPVQSKLGANMHGSTFSMKKTSDEGCEMLHEFRCGIKKLPKGDHPSMFEDADLKWYVDDTPMTTDYDDANFKKLQGLSPEELCTFVVTTGPLAMKHDCMYWCLQSSGASSCKAMDPDTCEISATGSNFVKCANDWFKNTRNGCELQIPDQIGEIVTTTTTHAPQACESCSVCVSKNGLQDQACSQCAGKYADFDPCNTDACKCGADSDGNVTTTKPCDVACSVCVHKSGQPWDNDNCAKCAKGQMPKDWPCNTSDCICKDGSYDDSLAPPSTTPSLAPPSTTPSLAPPSTTPKPTTTKPSVAPPNSDTCWIDQLPCNPHCETCIGQTPDHDANCAPCARAANQDNWWCQWNQQQMNCKCA